MLVAVLVAGALAVYVKYREVWHSIKRVHISKLDLGRHRPPVYNTDAINVLVIGSDSRSGRNGAIGGRAGISGQRSDTIMIMHLSPGHRDAVVLSLPRDSVVPVLACSPEPGFAGQQAQPGQIEQINSTFAFGGPGCLWKTVEQTTGIHIDHFISLNFTGFEKVINDVGGVSVCLPWAIDDAKSRLHLSRGVHHIWGTEALAFWRVRYIGEGSDLQRIRRDQYLMASVVKGVMHSHLLSSPARVYSVVTDAARAMTTDDTLNLATMLNIVESLRGLSAGSVQFIEAPTVAYPGDPNWVEWPQPQARRLFMAIERDQAVPGGTGGAKPGSPPTLASVPASSVHVEVLNGSGLNGAAGQAASALARRGFGVTGTGDAASFGYTRSVIDYADRAQRAAARTLAAQVPGSVLRRDQALAAGTIQLIVGSGYTGLAPRQASTASPSPSASASPSASPSASASPSPSASPAVSGLSRKYGGITANTNVCADSGAFSGPDGRS